MTIARPSRPSWRFSGVALTIALLCAAPLVLPEFRLNLLGRFLTYAMVAMALDLIWGYAGLLSLGHGLFFGLGAYAMAMYLKLESAPGLPDFMTWSGRDSLPLFWIPFRSPIVAVALAITAPALVAALLGYLVFRSRITGVYFSIITQALTLIVSILLIGQQSVTGGTNGITDLRTIFGFVRTAATTQIALYLATVICLLGVYLVCRRTVDSRFGRLLIALRDNEARVRLLGYNPVVLKTLVFALSAAIAGLAGALYVPQVGIISPSALGVVPSVEIVIWVAVGGRGWLIGGVLGALLVNWGKTVFSEAFPDLWQFGFGALLIGTVVLFPEGLSGFLRQLPPWLRRRWRTADGLSLRPIELAPREPSEHQVERS